MVCAGVHKVTGEVVAVKQIPRRLMSTPRLQAEVDMLRMAGQHKNVVGFRDLFSDDNFYYIVMGKRRWLCVCPCCSPHFSLVSVVCAILNIRVTHAPCRVSCLVFKMNKHRNNSRLTNHVYVLCTPTTPRQ